MVGYFAFFEQQGEENDKQKIWVVFPKTMKAILQISTPQSV